MQFNEPHIPFITFEHINNKEENECSKLGAGLEIFSSGHPVIRFGCSFLFSFCSSGPIGNSKYSLATKVVISYIMIIFKDYVSDLDMQAMTN